MNAPKFENRWLVAGIFTTLSELHIGDGGAGEIHQRHRPAVKDAVGKDDESDASTVCVDYENKAYIPGSGIKGPLRALVTDPATGRIHPDWEALIGSDNPDSGVGGKLEFWDAYHCNGKGIEEEAPDPQRLHTPADRKRPWWDHKRKTCVAVAVSLDRRTRTAKENLLYHLEYVPAEESFAFEIGGDNLEEEDIARVLFLLDQFNTGAATLGAQTSNGWGRVISEAKEIRRLDAADLAEWKQNPRAGTMACKPVDEVTRQRIDGLRGGLSIASSTAIVSIDLRLTLDSPWLIRDPRQRERSQAGKDLPEGRKPSDAVPVQDETGKPFVPAKSLRGILRSRAEMILRTVGLPCEDHPGRIQAVTTKGKTTRQVAASIRRMDLAAKLFGFSGWQAPLHVPRLIAVAQSTEHHQEFVAIDRFTGGAADGAKFNADLAGMTTLQGTLTIDLARLREVDPDSASIGLFALVLRDLAEGDIPIGSGSAKGQGLCHAEASITHEGHTYANLTEWFASGGVTTPLQAFRDTIPLPVPSPPPDFMPVLSNP
jgi:CRISPR/Cas system CSM-associated protein Csm3 (group 7 of RAMP superfamily)